MNAILARTPEPLKQRDSTKVFSESDSGICAEYQWLEAEASEVQNQIHELVESCSQMVAADFQTVGAEDSAEVEALREKLLEAEEREKQTQAPAELTKVGTVYVISNIGSFWDSVFKVGLTRRLVPQVPGQPNELPKGVLSGGL